MKNTSIARWDLLLGSLVVAAMLASDSVWAGAQEPPTPKVSEIDKIFSWATPQSPGCAIAVSLRGELVVNRAYGSADLERHVPITPDTIFDSGSLTKQFIAAAVLLLVEDGKLSLSDDIRNYVPELPDYGHTITIDHLLTHTSGIRDWTGILPLTGGNEDALTLILRQRGLADDDETCPGDMVLPQLAHRVVKDLPIDNLGRRLRHAVRRMRIGALAAD